MPKTVNMPPPDPKLVAKLYAPKKKKEEKLTPRQFGRRIAVCCATIVLCLQLYRVYLKKNRPETFPGDDMGMSPLDGGDTLEQRVKCAKRSHDQIPNCSPTFCGRVARDYFTSREQCQSLIELAEYAMKFGGGSGGATILDFPSGALSKGSQFISLYQLMKQNEEQLPAESVSVLKNVTHEVRKTIADYFGVSQIMSTTPRFISRMDEKPAQTMHDEYWHEHVDADQYPGFEYTALIYLNDQGVDADYTGGEFSFVDPGPEKGGDERVMTLQPKCGKLVFFTSGSENVHHVHKVEHGRRYALTIAFTCDKSKELKGDYA